MAKPADADGEEVASGCLYRLVPNWATHWDYERGLPEPRAFRRDGDIGVSVLIKERISVDAIFRIKPRLKDFAVCELVIEELLQDRDVWVKLDPDDDWGEAREAHALIMGITKRRIDWLRELGIKLIVKTPGPAKPPNPPE